MTGPNRAATVVLLAVLLPAADGLAQSQTFRAQADLVVVDVSVEANGVSVSGLTAADFRVTDNGVPQEVTFASATTIPLDVVLVVLHGAWPEAAARAWRAVPKVAGQLRPGDRVALTRFGPAIYEVLPLQPVPLDALPPMPRVLGDVRMLDALLQAMLRPGTPGRRHVIVGILREVDVMSASLPARLFDVAARCDAVIYLVIVQRTLPPGPSVKDITRITGGAVIEDSDVERAFRKILAALETSYLLSYVPKGVPRPGWHEITVSLNRPGNYTVRARRGYFGGN